MNFRDHIVDEIRTKDGEHVRVETAFVDVNGRQEWQTTIISQSNRIGLPFSHIPDSVTDNEETGIVTRMHRAVLRALQEGRKPEEVQSTFHSQLDDLVLHLLPQTTSAEIE